MLALVLACAAVMPGCGHGGDVLPREPGPVRVVASIPPLGGLVEPLLPEGAADGVRVLVPPGRSPHGYEPTPSDLAAVGRADLVVLVGMGIESGLPRSVREGPRVLTMGAALDLAAAEDTHDHGHDHGHAHDHSGPDPHLWLDPALVESFLPVLAEGVTQGLERSGADEATILGVPERLEELLAQVRAVDTDYRERLAPFAGAVVITQHAAWSRLAERYGIVIASEIQAAEDAEPSSGHLAELVRVAKERGVAAVLTEPQLNRAVAERVAGQIGVPVGVLDPIGSGDWVEMMQSNLEALVVALEAGRDAAASDGGSASGG